MGLRNVSTFPGDADMAYSKPVTAICSPISALNCHVGHLVATLLQTPAAAVGASLTRMQQQGKGLIIGQKGIKYGLQKPAGSRPAAPAPPKQPLGALFGGDSDSEEEDVGSQIARQAAKKAADAKVKKLLSRCLANICNACYHALLSPKFRRGGVAGSKATCKR